MYWSEIKQVNTKLYSPRITAAGIKSIHEKTQKSGTYAIVNLCAWDFSIQLFFFHTSKCVRQRWADFRSFTKPNPAPDLRRNSKSKSDSRIISYRVHTGQRRIWKWLIFVQWLHDSKPLHVQIDVRSDYSESTNINLIGPDSSNPCFRFQSERHITSHGLNPSGVFRYCTMYNQNRVADRHRRRTIFNNYDSGVQFYVCRRIEVYV